jgi:uncharacterized membrane protein
MIRKNLHPAKLHSMAALLWFAVCFLVILAPMLAANRHFATASIAYSLFTRVCHQMPERCFALAGYPLAVCHRCFGIYLGLAFGSLITRLPGIFRRRRAWIAAATIPMLVDACFPLMGTGTNTPSSRFGTGLLFGLMLATIFMQGIRELLYGARQRRFLCKGESL